VLAQLPQLILVWRDGTGSEAETRFTIHASLPVATIESAATVLVAALSAITGAVFVRQYIVYPFVPPGALYGAPTSDKFRAGIFTFDCVDAGQVGLADVPAIKDELLVTAGPGAGVLIDVTLSDVVSYLSVLHDNNVCNPFGSLLGALTAAYRQSRV
jgi:hypothetical protein